MTTTCPPRPRRSSSRSDARVPLPRATSLAANIWPKPSVTAAVEKLATAGLVERRADDSDGRVVWIAITTAGKRRIDARRARRTAWLTIRLDKLDPADVEILSRAADVVDRVVEWDDEL